MNIWGWTNQVEIQIWGLRNQKVGPGWVTPWWSMMYVNPILSVQAQSAIVAQELCHCLNLLFVFVPFLTEPTKITKLLASSTHVETMERNSGWLDTSPSTNQHTQPVATFHTNPLQLSGELPTLQRSFDSQHVHFLFDIFLCLLIQLSVSTAQWNWNIWNHEVSVPWFLFLLVLWYQQHLL